MHLRITESETAIAQPFLIHRAIERATKDPVEPEFGPCIQSVLETGHVAPDMNIFEPELNPFLQSVLEIDHVAPDIRG